jgi:hypothetical protein
VGYGKTEGLVVCRENQKRLKLDGFVYSPKFGYKVSWVFCRDIGTVVVGNSGNVILDGFLLYNPTSDLIGFNKQTS